MTSYPVIIENVNGKPQMNISYFPPLLFLSIFPHNFLFLQKQFHDEYHIFQYQIPWGHLSVMAMEGSFPYIFHEIHMLFQYTKMQLAIATSLRDILHRQRNTLQRIISTGVLSHNEKFPQLTFFHACDKIIMENRINTWN